VNVIAPALSIAFVALVQPALAGDPHSPQVAVSSLSEPAPISQNGATKPV
jgi:hypothetical protein